MQKFTLVLGISFLSAISAFGQTTHSVKSNAVYLGLGLDMGIPINEFSTYNDHIAVGGGFDLFFQPSVKIPVLVGFDLGFLGNGYKVQRQTLYADIVVGGTVIDQLAFPLRVETSNTISTGHVNLRILSPTRFFKPYVDAQLGFNNFSTNTSVYDESEEYYLSEADNPLITSSNQNSSWTFSYGAAAGLMVELNENILIDIRAAYTKGGEATYFVKDDIDNWEIEFSSVPTSADDTTDAEIDISALPKESTTDMIQGSVGIVIKF